MEGKGRKEMLKTAEYAETWCGVAAYHGGGHIEFPMAQEAIEKNPESPRAKRAKEWFAARDRDLANSSRTAEADALAVAEHVRMGCVRCGGNPADKEAYWSGWREGL